jgi:hypothetical protein
MTMESLALLIEPNASTSVDAIEAGMVAGFPRVEVPVFHHFGDGIYAREIRAVAGTFMTGKLHRTEHLNIISQGVIEVWVEGVHGPEQRRTITAPCAFVAPPGTRRVGLVHEDVVWTTVHANPDNVRDVEQLERLLIEPHVNTLLPHPDSPLTPEMACLG